MNNKIDPIRDKYFAPLEKAEKWSARLFYATALVSLAVPLIDSSTYRAAYTFAQVLFGALAVAGVVLGLATKLYWAPRAAEKRISDFVSAALAVNLTPERTQGYYNNSEKDPIRKTALQVLENSWFTKEIARLMCVRRRAVVSAYAVLWIVVIANRSTPIDLVSVGCQVLFSEGIISSVIRLEWLRAKTEKIFDAMFRHLSVSNATTPAFVASVLEFLVCYENHKATSNVTLSTEIFNANNTRLSAEWDRMRASLGA